MILQPLPEPLASWVCAGLFFACALGAILAMCLDARREQR